MQLYTFWRSQAAFRVRIVLGLKGLQAEMVYVDLLKSEQASPEYRKVNSAMLLPALIDGDGPPLVQSLAIMEYLDEVYPDPPLLPKSPRDRAHVRALAQSVAVDAHPFVVPRVRTICNISFIWTSRAGCDGFGTGLIPRQRSSKKCSRAISEPVGSVAVTLRA